MGLDDGRGAVDVHHEAGEKVTLAVHQPVGIVVGTGQREGAAQLQGGGEAAPEEVGRYAVGAEIEDAHGDAPYLEVAHADEAAVGGVHRHGLTLLEPLGKGFGNSSGEYPRVKTVERFLFAAF